MANRYTIGSGLASDITIFDGAATVPVEGDRVLIKSGHTVTMDGTYIWGDDLTSTITIDGISTSHSITVIGKLKFSRSVNSQLTAKGFLDIRSGGELDMGKAGDVIPTGVYANLVLNYSASMAVGKYGLRVNEGAKARFYGGIRTRITKITAAVAAAATAGTSAAATGWEVGDRLYFPNTTVATDNAYDVRTLAGGYTPGSTTLAFAALTNAHVIQCPVVNLSSNVTVKAHAAAHGYTAQFLIGTGVAAGDWEFAYCSFERPQGTFSGGLIGDSYGVTIGATTVYSTVPWTTPVSVFQDVAFWGDDSTLAQNAATILARQIDTPIVATRCAYVSVRNGASYGIRNDSFTEYVDCFSAGYSGVYTDNGGVFTRGYCCVNNTSGSPFISTLSAADWVVDGTIFVGPALASVFNNSAGNAMRNIVMRNVDAEETFVRGSGTNQFGLQTTTTIVSLTLENCFVGSRAAIPAAQRLVMSDASFIKSINKNRDVTLQEEYYRRGSVIRDNAEKQRSTSSMSMIPGIAGTVLTRKFSIAVSSGEVVRLIGYCKYDSTYYNAGTGFVAPTMTLSGTINGIALTPVVYTAASANAGNWELIDKSITNSTGAAGNLDITFSVQAGVTTGKVFWDGIALPPMVVLARHYGFLFDESNPKRFVNGTVSAAEATAAAYTGFTITWGASLSTTAVTLDNTFQKLYDYSQAQGCLNLASVMPLTGAGVAGSPLLFAVGNVTVSAAKTLNGPGSLSMSTYTLTGAVPWAYTYTGGTFSQAAAVPTFSGGTLAIGGTGTYTFVQAASTLVNVTPAGTGTYNFGSGTFTGTLTVNNLAAHAITVNVPSGTTTSDTGNVGGAITFSAPQVFQSVTVSGLATTARIQIYDVTASTQLYLGVPGTASYTWTDPDAAVGSRSIRLRIMRCDGADADIIVDKIIGTCGTTEATKAVSYLHDAVPDAAYNANAVDGSTITGFVIDDSNMRLEIASGTIVAYGGVNTLVIDGRKAYAYETYWLSTDAGLIDEARFIIAVDGVNLRFVDFKLKNTTSGPVYPVIINNAYVVDDATGVSASLTDYTGGPIHYAPDHMISNVVTVGGVNIITGDIADVPARVQTGLTSQGYTAARATHLEEIAKIEGLSIADPVIIDNDAQTRVAGLISQTVIKVGNVTTIQRL